MPFKMNKTCTFLPFVKITLPFCAGQQAFLSVDYPKRSFTGLIKFLTCGEIQKVLCGLCICKNLLIIVLHAVFPVYHMQGIFLKYPLNVRLFSLSLEGPKVAWELLRGLAHTCKLYYFDHN